MGKTKSNDEVIEDSIISFETFRKIGSYEKSNLLVNEPSCFNGDVKIHKYKITIELIEEPKDILAERLQKLWDECDNMHHWNPLTREAVRIGYELQNPPGTKRNNNGKKTNK